MKLHELDHAILTYLAANAGQHNSVSIARELEEDCQDTAKRLFNLNKKQWVDKQRSEGKNTRKNVYQINATGRNILQKANEKTPASDIKLIMTATSAKTTRIAAPDTNAINPVENNQPTTAAPEKVTTTEWAAKLASKYNQKMSATEQPKKHWINEESVEDELELLHQKLNKKWQIDDRELKVKVLYKLSDILDASIADVLNHIASDLERA